MMIEDKKRKSAVQRANTPFESTVDIFKMFNLLPFPYPSKISFVSLINYWEGKLVQGTKVEQLIAREIQDQLNKEGAVLKQPIENLEVLEGLDELISLLISIYFPHHDQQALLRLSGPFNTLPFYHSPKLQTVLLQNTITTNIDKHPERIYKYIIYRTGCMILNKFYGQHLQFEVPYIFSVNRDKSKLKTHYQTEIDDRFSEVKKLKRLKKLSDEQIHELLSNVEDTELWLKYLPPTHFEFQGIFCTLLTDATASHTLSQLKDSLLQRDALLRSEQIKLLEQNLRTFFKQPDLRLGVCAINQHQMKGFNEEQSIKHGLITDTYPKLLSSKYKNSIYNKVATSKDILVIENLIQYPDPSPLEQELLGRGIRSILVAPLTNKHNEVIGLLELASPIAFNLNSVSALTLKSIISLFNVAIERSQAELINRVEAIIRKNFTSIHPSVEWAFLDRALQLLNAKESPELLDDDRFVFRDNYPLFGQSDIVSSTVTRNQAIQTDLINNLYQIKKILVLCNQQYYFPLAEQILQEVSMHIQQLKSGITSNTEYNLMKFIRKEVHPILRYLKKKNPLVKEAYKKYQSLLDPQMETIFDKRKDYEKSVAMINRMLSTFLDEQQELVQEMCPHYYEKFQTDGVAYNIYIGQSLLKKGKFTSFHLKNLRLWQLVSMCEMTRKVAAIQPQLPTPLTTAQLILVHSTPISIRFRMDEKRFDVDGAYNARYEIIKKRIDKAYIEGGNERLTVTGKIAIVYQQEKDKKEYLSYLRYLIRKGYIDKNIEDLSLKKLQGVQGLKALRIRVLCDNKKD